MTSMKATNTNTNTISTAILTWPNMTTSTLTTTIGAWDVSSRAPVWFFFSPKSLNNNNNNYWGSRCVVPSPGFVIFSPQQWRWQGVRFFSLITSLTFIIYRFYTPPPPTQSTMPVPIWTVLESKGQGKAWVSARDEHEVFFLFSSLY